VGCEPENVEEGIGLTETVAAAVEPAVRRLVEIIHKVHERKETELSLLAAKDRARATEAS